jgi:hypothetical protein
VTAPFRYASESFAVAFAELSEAGRLVTSARLKLERDVHYKRDRELAVPVLGAISDAEKALHVAALLAGTSLAAILAEPVTQ